MVRSKLCIDTDICIKVANGTIDAGEWKRAKRHISNNYRYCISFVTLKELFTKSAEGSEAYFEQNKQPLRVLQDFARRRYWDLDTKSSFENSFENSDPSPRMPDW